MPKPIPTRIAPDARPSNRPSRQIGRDFRALLDDGAKLVVAGTAREDPLALLSDGYTPKHEVELFGYRFLLANVRQNPLLRFFPAYVVPPPDSRGRVEIYPRIFYKDISLTWRSGSHVVHTDDELWIGKGDTRIVPQGEYEIVETMESTTELPFELHHALDLVLRRARVIRRDEEILTRILRNAPPHRIAPYRDFTEPRRRAAAVRGNSINGGKPVAWFARADDPGSLAFAPGFEPDFSRSALVGVTSDRSRSFGGTVRRFRFLSRNRKIQYLFFAAPHHVWLASPQALTTELSTYGVRTVDVIVDDRLCVPGYEYHVPDDGEHPDSNHSQIPPGFVGPPNPHDPDRADASPWLEQLPVVRQFRRRVLSRGA